MMKIFINNSLNEQRRIVAYLDSVQARPASLRELQSQTQKELNCPRCCRPCWIGLCGNVVESSIYQPERGT